MRQLLRLLIRRLFTLLRVVRGRAGWLLRVILRLWGTICPRLALAGSSFQDRGSAVIQQPPSSTVSDALSPNSDQELLVLKRVSASHVPENLYAETAKALATSQMPDAPSPTALSQHSLHSIESNVSGNDPFTTPSLRSKNPSRLDVTFGALDPFPLRNRSAPNLASEDSSAHVHRKRPVLRIDGSARPNRHYNTPISARPVR